MPSGHPRRSDKSQFYACVSIGVQSNTCYADRLTADRGRQWWSDTQTPGVGVQVKCAVWNLIPTVNLSRVTSLHSRRRSNDWSCLMQAVSEMSECHWRRGDEYILLALCGSLHSHSFPRSLSPGLRGSAWLSSILTVAVMHALSS